MDLRHFVSTFSQEFVAEDAEGQAGQSNLKLSPWELLLSALATWTSTTILLYSRRKHWPLISVTINSTHELLDSSLEFSQSDSKLPSADVIRQNILLEGNLSEKQSDRLGHLARQCPIYRTLVHGLIIEESVGLMSG